MTTYYAISGQSLPDVCLNTYGSMDYFFKLLQDNGITDPNGLPSSSMAFVWDNTLVVDAQNERTILTNNIKFATANSGNGNTYSIIYGGAGAPISNAGAGTTTPTITSNMYQKTSATNYTATADNESVVTFVPLQGKDILQIERNIEPLLPTEYFWNGTTGVLTLTNPLQTGETLFILYTEMIIA
jgi:hypothetical protein